MYRRQQPQLPLEVWIHIICRISDCAIAQTWFSCRSVSRLVRVATEEAFLSRHLRKTSIVFDTCGYKLQDFGGSFYVPLAFQRLLPDRSRAVFSLDVEELGRYKDQAQHKVFRPSNGDEVNLQMWRDAMQDYTGVKGSGPCFGGVARPDVPPYTIVVRRHLNDSELPGLEVDYDGVEIAFDWRAMFDRFFGEEEAVRRRCPPERFPQSKDSTCGNHRVAWAVSRANLHASVYNEVRQSRIVQQYRNRSYLSETCDTEEGFWERERRQISCSRHEAMKDDRRGVLFMDPINDEEDGPPVGFAGGNGRAFRR